MSSVNKVILVGNLGKAPEIRRTQDGRAIAHLSLATSETWRDKASGERREKTEWHRIVIFNEILAKVVEQYCKKGSKLYIEGSLQTRKWTDKDGTDRYSTEVVVQGFGGGITLLDTRPNGSTSGEYERERSEDARTAEQVKGIGQAAGRPGSMKDQLEDDLPF